MAKIKETLYFTLLIIALIIGLIGAIGITIRLFFLNLFYLFWNIVSSAVTVLALAVIISIKK